MIAFRSIVLSLALILAPLLSVAQIVQSGADAFMERLSFVPDPWRGELMDAFLAYPPDVQSEIVGLHMAMSGGDPLPDNDDPSVLFVREMNVPIGLRERIMEEVVANEASERNRLGISRFLDRLEAEGDLSLSYMALIERYAPVNSESIPIVRALAEAEASLADAEARADDAEARADDAEARADDAEAEARAALAEARAQRDIAARIAAAAAQAEAALLGTQ